MKLDFENEIAKLRKEYTENSAGSNFSCLVLGHYGSGKTSFTATGRKPILIDSFDPRGTLVLDDEVKKGNVVVRTFWNESSKNPSEYVRWENMWEHDIATNFLENFGTYAIDSFTTFIQAMTNKVAHTARRTNNLPAIQDYQLIYNNVRDIVKMTSAQRVDFVVTGHIVNVQDGLTGEITAELDTYKGLKNQVPLLFSEKYIILARQKQSDTSRILLTAPFGRYIASTQLGAGGKLDREEIPNLKHILKKVGMNFEDKPQFVK
jgi:hypothetical protein